MDTQSQNLPAAETLHKPVTIKAFGLGSAGLSVLEQMIARGLPATSFVALSTDAQPLAASAAAEKIRLENKLLRGLGTGGDPERGRALAEEHQARLKSLCEGVDVVFIIAGLGGGTGTGIAPVLARLAKEAGALVLGCVSTPFSCEGSRRQLLAEQGLEELKLAADGVLCLPNQKAFKLIDENTSVLETFKLTNQLLADGARSVWRLLSCPGLIEIHWADICGLLRDRHSENAFAVAEALGATRSGEVLDKLLAHPMLDDGQVLADSAAVLVSLVGGPDLTMAEVNRVMEQLNAKCARAQVIMGAAIDESFRERLVVTVMAVRQAEEQPERPAIEPGTRLRPEELNTQLLERSATARPNSRFVPPAPALPPEKMEQMLVRQGAGGRARKTSPKLRQTQLPLEIVSKGRFDKSEPTIHKGEDLDVPTYIRRGVSLN